MDGLDAASVGPGARLSCWLTGLSTNVCAGDDAGLNDNDPRVDHVATLARYGIRNMPVHLCVEMCAYVRACVFQTDLGAEGRGMLRLNRRARRTRQWRSYVGCWA